MLPALYSSFLLLLLSHVSRVQLCVTPQGAAHQAPVPGILQARTLGWGCHCLLPLPASYLFHMVVYICQCYDLSSSYPFLPHLCSQVCSLCLCLYCVCVCVCVHAQLCLILYDSPDFARLLCPWNFLDKNTGMVFHFLLQCLYCCPANSFVSTIFLDFI